MQRVDCLDLRVRQAQIATLAAGATQGIRLECRLAANRILNQRITRAVGLAAGPPHGVGDILHLGRTNPAFAHRYESRTHAGMLQSNPIDDGYARKDAVKIIRVALRHGQRLATAFG